MDISALEQHVSEWCREYCEIAGLPMENTGPLARFLVKRLLENGVGGVEENCDVLRVTDFGETRRVRVTGFVTVADESGQRVGGQVHYELAGGGMSMFVKTVDQFRRDLHPQDMDRFCELMDEIDR